MQVELLDTWMVDEHAVHSRHCGIEANSFMVNDLQDQVNVGNVEDEQVLGDEEEGQPRGAGVGLREDESDMGEAPRLPPLGLERDE